LAKLSAFGNCPKSLQKAERHCGKPKVLLKAESFAESRKFSCFGEALLGVLSGVTPQVAEAVVMMTIDQAAASVFTLVRLTG